MQGGKAMRPDSLGLATTGTAAVAKCISTSFTISSQSWKICSFGTALGFLKKKPFVSQSWRLLPKETGPHFDAASADHRL